ncbi:MAG: integrase core domain-containing protein [Nitrososphaerota archaeon]
MNPLGVNLEYIQKHTPEDNGNIELFHASLKTDYTWLFEFSDYSVELYAIELVFNGYNENMLHPSINYLPPRELGRKFLNDESFRCHEKSSFVLTCMTVQV